MGTNLIAGRTRFTARLWRVALWLADKIGGLVRIVFVEGRAPLIVLGAIVGGFLSDNEAPGVPPSALAVWGVSGGLLLLPAIANARRRVMVGDFTDVSGDPGREQRATGVDLGNLLQTELSRFGSLFRVVENRRAVSSGLGAGAELDATISVDEVVGALQDTVSAETKVDFGPIGVPVAPLMTLAGRVLRAPRLTGSLHLDGETLILTARQRGVGGLSWWVARPLDERDGSAAPEDSEVSAGDEDEVVPLLSGMVRELALRIFTDLALGRDVRWEASAHFVNGLANFRAALRTPKDRKVNLRKAERSFLDALSEDEDFPTAYYNLGVVYTELHGLAVAGGRVEETEMHLHAAETSFKWAIEREPKRWDTFLALAQTQFGHKEWENVIDDCNRVLRMRARWRLGSRARAFDLRARAQIQLARRQADDDKHALAQQTVRRAIRSARRGMHDALSALIFSRLRRRSARGEEGDREPRCADLAGACAATYGLCYSKLIPRGRTRPVANRARSLLDLSERLLNSIPDVHFEFGIRALNRGDFSLSREEIRQATQSDPKRSAFVAGDALRRVREHAASARGVSPNIIREIEKLCDEAVESMAGVFAPARDLDACELVITVYGELAHAAETRDSSKAAEALREKARQLTGVLGRVRTKLSNPTSEASVSALFLRELQHPNDPWTGEWGLYGEAVRDAVQNLKDDDAEAALEHAERATSLNPLSSLAWETLGDAHNRLRDFQSAREAWQKARTRDPDNPDLYDKIGSSHWQLAFAGHGAVDTTQLRRARGYFRSALLLYGSGSVDEERKTHYRLAKLYTGLSDFANSFSHLTIYEAVSRVPPLVGWQLLGQAHLAHKHFEECEYYFAEVVRHADTLLFRDRMDPAEVIGDKFDEGLWPLGLVRAWGHLGLALSFAERDGDVGKAADELRDARTYAGAFTANGFPTRIVGAFLDCEGMIHLRKDELEPAIEKFREAVGAFPYSRAYLHLALALMERVRSKTTQSRDSDLPTAARALKHAVSLGPAAEPTPEVQDASAELDRLTAVEG